MVHELDARQQTVDTLTSDNDKLNKSKKKIQSEVTSSATRPGSANLAPSPTAWCCHLVNLTA